MDSEISQPVRNRGCDQSRRNRIRVSIIRNTMARIERDEHVRQTGIIENSLSKLPLSRLLGEELRDDDEGHRSAGASELERCAQDLPRNLDSAFDRFLRTRRCRR